MTHYSAWMKIRGVSFIYRVVLFFNWVVFKTLYRHRVYGIENFCKGPAILASNHISFLDPPLIAISAPEEVHFLARKSLFKSNGFGALIKALNALPVSGTPSDHQAFKQVLQIFKNGEKLIIFPEGERSFDNVFNPIKPGIVLLISRSQVPVIPVYIHGAYEIWPRGQKIPRLWGKTVCIFGKPIHIEKQQDLSREDIQEWLSREILNSWTQMKKWYEDGAKGPIP